MLVIKNEEQLINYYYEIKQKIIIMIEKFPELKKELIKEIKKLRDIVLKTNHNQLNKLRHLIFLEKRNEILSLKNK